MATQDSFSNRQTGLAAPATNISSWTVDDIRKSDILVFRESATEYINSVVAPNGFQVGLLDSSFRTDLLVTGHITGSGIVYSELGFSGSLTKLIDGSSYLVAGSGMTITTQSNGSILLASSGGSSGSRVKTEYTGNTVSQGSPFTTTGINFADYSYDFHKIDVFYNGELIKSGSSSNLTAGTCDYTLGVDDSSGGKITYSFAINSSDVVTIICGSGAGGGGGGGTTYSAGVGLSLTGTQFTVKKDGSTIGTNSSDQLEVLKTPGTLTAGNGLNSNTFDGAANRTISIKPVSSSPITVSSTGVGMDITSQTGVSLAGTDELLVYDGSGFGKTTAQAIANLASGGSGAPTNAQYLVLANDSNLSHERALVFGNGLTTSDGGANGSYTVSVLTNNAGGLQFVSGKLAVKVGDFVGTGLTNNGGNIDIDASAIAGTGLSGSGTTLSINFGQGANQAAKGSNTVTINAGDGLSSGGSFAIGAASSSVNLDVASTDLKGRGLSVSSNNLEVYMAGGSGITITTGSVDGNGEPLQIAADGLTISNFADATIQTSSELGTNAANFADNDTSILTAAGIKKYVNSLGFGSGGGSGSVTSVGINAGNLIDISGSPITSSGNIQVDVDLSELTTSTSNADGDFFVVIDDSNGQKKLTKANIDISGFNNDANYLSTVTFSNIHEDTITLSSESFADNDTTLMTSAAINDLIEGKGYITSAGDITSVVAGSGLKTGGSTGDVTVDINYDGASDSLIKEAYDGTGITVDSANDLLAIHDATDNKVKYIRANQIQSAAAGVIGSAEDGDYTDGLFATFTNTTPTGTAIDKINEVLKLLAPSPAPGVQSINASISNGINAKLSFGASNTGGSTYINSGTSAGFSAVDTNGTYSAGTSGSNSRLGIYTSNTNIEGIVNHDVGIAQYANSTVNHVADAFGNGELGNLKLEVNGAVVHTVDLSSFTGSGLPGSGATSNSLTSDSGFYQLSTAKDATSEGATSFNIFKHRTTKYRIHHTEQRQGWNYARVVHSAGGVDYTTNYIEWINDTDTTAITTTSTSVSNIAGSDEFVLSGIKYFKTASYDYSTVVNNAHRALHTGTPIAFNPQYGSITSATDQNSVNLLTTFPGVASGQDFTKTINISASGTFNVASSGFPAAGLLNQGSTININVVHPNTTKNQTGIGAATVSNLLMWYPSASPTATSEDFNSETWRQQVGTYNTQAAVYTSSAFATPWNSATKVNSSDAGHNTGLVLYQGQLRAPRNTLLNGDFASITNSPGSNADYSGITSGTRTYYRAFKKTDSGNDRDLKITMSGNAEIIANGGTLSGNKIKTYIKLPSNGTDNSGWMDMATAFSYNSTADNNGGRIMSWTPNIASSTANYFSFGTGSIAQNDYIMMKIEADAGWTGNLSSINMQFGASGGAETSVPDNCSSLNSNDTGVDAKLSFGSSVSIPNTDANHPYENVNGTNSLSTVNINSPYDASSGTTGRRGIFNGNTIIDGKVNSGEAGDSGNFAAHAINNGNLGSIKLFVNDTLRHTTDLTSFTGSGAPGSGSGSDLTAGSGFTSISTATNVTWSDGIPDYRYFVRTMNYQVATAHQRPGHNWVRVVHTHGGSDYTTNYVEWVNDPNNDSLAYSGQAIDNFSDSDISQLSGISYFNSPSSQVRFRISNLYRNVYSKSNSAIGFKSLSNLDITSLGINGAGIANKSVSTDVTSLPNLGSSSGDYTLPVDVTGSINYVPTKTLPGTYGTSAANVSIIPTAIHPLKNPSGLDDSAMTKTGFLVWTPTEAGSNATTTETFTGEGFRLEDSTFATTTDITNKTWDSTQSLVGNGSGGNAGHNTGLAIYNGYLIPPSQAGNSGDFTTGIQGPSGNVDYTLSNVSNNTRTYLRSFYNPGTGDSADHFILSLTGTASLKSDGGPSNAGTLGNNTNIHIKVKVVYHSTESTKTTGWLDAGEQATGSNADGSGCSGEGLSDLNVVWNNNTQTVKINYPGGRGLYGTSSPYNRNYVIIKIETHKQWTGKFTAMSITSYN